MKFSILDIGTNTFNLLNATCSGKVILTVENYREAIKLGKGGIHKGYIHQDALKRAFTGILNLKMKVEDFQPDKTIIAATDALRNAKNGQLLVQELEHSFNAKVNIIDGLTEAKIIAAAVFENLPDTSKNYLLVDLGGGSVECTVIEAGKIEHQQSYPLGVSRIMEMFDLSTSLNQEQEATLRQYFGRTLADLKSICNRIPIDYIVGSSGAFDSFLKLSGGTEDTITKEQFNRVHARIMNATLAERLSWKELPNFRAEMIQIGSVLLHFMLDDFSIPGIIVSSQALKEGLLLNELNLR